MGVERCLGLGVEAGAGPRQRVEVAAGDLAVGQRLTEASVAGTHLTPAHRRPPVTASPASVVGDHRLGRLRLATGGELAGTRRDAGVDSVAERTDLRNDTGQVAEGYPITGLRMFEMQLEKQVIQER